MATIVFADIVGSTELVEGRDPEDVRRTLDPFFELARATFEEHDGQVEKYIGDAVMAVFGVPQVHGDDPDRAVSAALALIDRLGNRADQLEVRIGIETGEILAEPGRTDLAVTGDATHAAARLQQAARPCEILVGERAAAGCRRAILSEPRQVRARGFAEPLTARTAVGMDGAGRVAATPFLGRGAELERLRLGYLRTQREREPNLALIVGEAGVGKTRLARELLATLRDLAPAPEVLIGRNPPYGDGIAFWALGEILRAAAQVSSDADSEEIHDGLESRLTAVEPERRGEIASTLVTVSTGDGGDGRPTPASVRLAWRRLLASLSAERPLVVAVDDTHWADEEFLELLEDSTATLSGYPVMFLCTARPELVAARPGFAADGIRVELGPLQPEAAVELAAALLEDGDAELTHQVAQTSGGNPFFTEEIARSLASGNGDRRLPDTVQTAIASRLDGLPASEKLVLQHAAVLGDRFRIRPLAALLDRQPRDELHALVSRSLVDDRSAEEPGLFSFHHQLIRDVAYESLPRSDRTLLHEHAAAGIGADSVEHHPELAEVVAFHRMKAAELEPSEARIQAAFDAACWASSLAVRRGAAPRAQELLEEAAAIAPNAANRIGKLTEAADVAMMRTRGDEAFRLLRAAGQVAENAEMPLVAAQKYALAIEIPTRSGGISGYVAGDELPGLLERARSLAPDPDPTLRAQLRLDDSWMAWRFGREDEMGEPAYEGLELARAVGDPRLLSSALDAVAGTAHNEGRYRDTVAATRERIEVLERAPNPNYGIYSYERYDAVFMLSEGLTRIGDLEGAVQVEMDAAEELLLHAPHRAYSNALQPLMHLGRWDRAIELGTSVRSNWLEQGRPPFAPLAGDLAVVGYIHGLRDDDVAAEDWFDVAEQVAMNQGPLSGVRIFQADLALYRGDPERALSILDSREPDFWCFDQHRVKRLEVLAALERESEAREALAAVRARGCDDPLHTAVMHRATAALEGTVEPLATACEILDRQGFAFEGARTRWLAGGAERERAREVLRALGAIPPVEAGVPLR